MYRQIIIPKDTQLLLQIPSDFVGKQVEIIAFELGKEENIIEIKNTPQKIEKIFDRFRIDMRNFKFDRNEANNYE